MQHLYAASFGVIAMIRGAFLMTQIKSTKHIREGSFGFLIQTLARDIDTKMKRALEEVDVDIKIFANLMLLADEDGINQRSLGEKLNFPEYFTSRNVDALVEAGFAERRPDPKSRRTILIYLTEALLEPGYLVIPGIELGQAMLEISERVEELENGTLIDNKDSILYAKAYQVHRGL